MIEPATRNPDLTTLLADGRYLLQALDVRQAVFVPVTSGIIAESPFLDKRMALPADAPRYQVPVRALIEQSPTQPAGPSRYLMHTSHVGSTLISRALGHADDTISLREPLAIRFLSQMRSHIDDGCFLTESLLSPNAFQALQRRTLALLNRPFEGRHRVVIKCTSWTNNMADTLLLSAAERPRVVAISTALEVFVANMLKSAGAKQDLYTGAASRLRRLARLLPGHQPVLHRMKPGELAASAWLVELMSMQRGAAAAGVIPEWLDFDAYLQAPLEQTARLATHLELPWTDAATTSLGDSGLLGRYAKTREEKPYDAAARAAILTDFQVRHPDTIRDARKWLDAVMAENPGVRRCLPVWAA